MVSIIKTDTIKNDDNKKILTGELRGLSTDTKPTTMDGNEIGNGSVFVEIDTQKIFFYDYESKTWKEV